jgi:uncharacterized protein (DUF1697 family)
MVAPSRKPAKQVAFLRAINVGGRGIVKMAEVQRAFAEAGCTDVTTFIASGNIIFVAPPGDDERWRGQVRRNIARLLGAEPDIVYRSMRQLERLVAAAPFGELTGDRALKLYVVLANGKAKRRPVFPLALPREGLEAIAMAGGDVLIVSRRKPNGMYGFPNNWIEQELGITSTARNWTTITKIVALDNRAREQLHTSHSKRQTRTRS